MAHRIRRNDTVLVIAGKDRNKKGKVTRVYPREGKVTVAGVNMIKRHLRPRGQVRQAGIIEREAPIPVSRVMFLCNRCNRPARIGFRFLEDGKKVRFCRACGEVVE